VTNNKRHSVLLISNLFSAGPSYGGVCKELAQELAEQHWQVTTTSALTNRYLRPIDMSFTIWKTRDNYSVAQIDVFSGPAFRWAETSAWTLRRLRKPFVLTLHGGNLPDFSSRHHQRVQRLLNSAARVTTPSRYLLEQMSSFRPDMLLIPNPLELRSYPFRLRKQPAPDLLYLRALHRMYNPVMAVEVAKLLRDDLLDAHLTLVGPDKGDGAAADVHNAVQSLGLANAIRIVGSIPKAQVPNAISEADIFLNTTNFDNTPISVLEAMACGLCIVSTTVGGIPYLLTHEHDALLVPPNDPHAMAAAIRRILTETGLAERLSRNARSTAEQFDWSVILPQWEEVLMDVIRRDRHGKRG